MIKLTDKELTWEFMKYLRGFWDRGQISEQEMVNITLLGLYNNTAWDHSSPCMQELLQDIISANHSDGTENPFK